MFIIALGIIAIIYYFLTNTPPNNEISLDAPTATPVTVITPIPTVASVSESPISPLSPASPITAGPATATIAPDDLRLMAQEVLHSGLDLYESGNYEAALDKFAEVLTLDPNNALAYNATAAVYIDQGNYEQALDALDTALNADPLLAAALYNRGRAFRFLGRYDEAIVELKQAAQFDPDGFGYRSYGNIGIVYHIQGKYEEALDAYVTAISYDDTKADVFFLRGETYLALDDYEAAILDYLAATSRFANYGRAYQSLGYAYYKTAQFGPAQQALNQALENSSDNSTTHFYKMLVHLATNQVDAAQVEASTAISSLSDLTEEEQIFIIERVVSDLESFAQENPSQAQTVDNLIEMILNTQ